jgi:hypothetical protein
MDIALNPGTLLLVVARTITGVKAFKDVQTRTDQANVSISYKKLDKLIINVRQRLMRSI